MTAPYAASIADLHERLGQLVAGGTSAIAARDHTWPVNGTPMRGLEIEGEVRRLSYATRAELANWKAEVTAERIAQLEQEWNDTDAALEHARVKYGMGSPQFRAFARAIGSTAATRGLMGEM